MTNSKRTRKAARTPRQAFLHSFFNSTCCNQPQQTGYDVVMLACRHNGYASVEVNAYYAMCDSCGNIDTLCSQCVDDDVADNLAWWQDAARNS